jgi:hypothetical protein
MTVPHQEEPDQPGTTSAPRSGEIEAIVLAVAQAVEDCIQEAMPSRSSQMRCFYERVSEAALHRHIRTAVEGLGFENRAEVERLKVQLAARNKVIERIRGGHAPDPLHKVLNPRCHICLALANLDGGTP